MYRRRKTVHTCSILQSIFIKQIDFRKPEQVFLLRGPDLHIQYLLAKNYEVIFVFQARLLMGAFFEFAENLFLLLFKSSLRSIHREYQFR